MSFAIPSASEITPGAAPIVLAMLREAPESLSALASTSAGEPALAVDAWPPTVVPDSVAVNLFSAAVFVSIALSCGVAARSLSRIVPAKILPRPVFCPFASVCPGMAPPSVWPIFWKTGAVRLAKMPSAS